MSVTTNLKALKDQLQGKNCTLVAVSKTKPAELILEAYEAGHRDFGENKAQEMADKYEKLPKDIRWHMIGHLQRNKVKYIAPFVSLIQSVDSARLLAEVNKQAERAGRTIDCLLQVHIAEEESKFGLSEEELTEIVQPASAGSLRFVRIVGLMGMATFTENADQIRKEFRYLKSLFEKMKSFQGPNVQMRELSMGMSGDYEIALQEGATIVRVGSAIFGERNYNK